MRRALPAMIRYVVGGDVSGHVEPVQQVRVRKLVAEVVLHHRQPTRYQRRREGGSRMEIVTPESLILRHDFIIGVQDILARSGKAPFGGDAANG